MRNNKKLSIWRLAVLITVFVGLVYFSVKKVDDFRKNINVEPVTSMYTPYVDITATPKFEFEQLDSDTAKNVVLSFIVASKVDPCEPSWGGYYSLDEARSELDLERRIARFAQKNGEIAISFGGLLNDELAVSCEDTNKLVSAYLSVIERYDVDTVDFDIEGSALSDLESEKRRALAISEIQKRLSDEGKNLAVWITLPVAPFGLTEHGTDTVALLLEHDIELAGINVMTMDYGASKSANQSMFEASKSALIETHRQLGILYKQAGKNLTDETLWSKIGATPMIGQNDIADEVFSLDDAKDFNEFARSKNIARMSIWSANRDIQCGDNYVNLKVVSDSCSGVKQEQFEFSKIFIKNFDGLLSGNSDVTTVESPIVIVEDDPEQSPYQIWSENGTYLEGTKVVWHGNVYEAKWWTTGDLPDNPVLQNWETPWQLIGPVLPGEELIEQPKLPDGYYPTWSGEQIYEAGQRVIFEDVPYQAKWWTQGDSPASASSNANSSAWVPLTRDEVKRLLEDINK